jgi:hypothetical protein
MPHRPPKIWWRGCVSSVDSRGGAIDPRRVCGAVWSRKSTAEKRALTIMAKHKRKKGTKRHRIHARTSGAPRKRLRTVRTRTAGALRRRPPARAPTKRVAKTANAGALPLLGDVSQAGRRRLKLAERLGLKVR